MADIAVEEGRVILQASPIDKRRGSMKTHGWSLHRCMVWVMLVVSLCCTRLVLALEVGDVAPDFTLQSTFGTSITLGQFKGKKHVLIEFYSLDFNPT